MVLIIQNCLLVFSVGCYTLLMFLDTAQETISEDPLTDDDCNQSSSAYPDPIWVNDIAVDF